MANFESRLNQTLDELKNHWQSQTPIVVKQLEEIIHFAQNNGEISFVYFEYAYEYFTIVCYFENNERTLIENDRRFIDQLFLSEISDREIDLADEAIESEEKEELFDEYCDKKYPVFEQWFINCWQQAKKNQPFSKRAFFSVHDSYYIFDLQRCIDVQGDSLEPKKP